MVVITYNSQAPWGTTKITNTGLPATPYFSMNKEPIMLAGKIGEITNITLQGQITEADGIVLGYANLGAVRDAILNTFSNSFKELHVYDNDPANLVLATGVGQTETEADVYKCENVIVDSINFPDQKYLSGGILDWSVTLKCYEESYFDDMGIIEKADSFSMNKDSSDMITITHRIYAKGVNTTDLGVCKGGFDHARTFVESRRGLGNIGNTFIGPYANSHTTTPILTDEAENINRLEGTYEITETWKADPHDLNNFQDENNEFITAGKVHIRYSVDINKSTFDSDFTEARVTYKFTGGKNTTATEMRDTVKLATHSGTANEMYTKAINHGLNIHTCTNFTRHQHEPIDINIEEDFAAKTFTKIATYTNDPRWVTTGSLGYPVWVDHDVSIDTDEITSITTVSISGNIGSVGPQAKQNLAIQDFLKNAVIDPSTGTSHASGATGVRTGADASQTGVEDLTGGLGACGTMLHGQNNMLVGEHPHSTNTITEQYGSLINIAGIWARGYYTQYCYIMDMPKSINYTGAATINPITLNINNPKNIEISQDVERNSARFSLAYSDADWIENYESASYNISVQKPIVYRKSNPSANIDGHYSLTSFGGKENLFGIIEPMYTRQKHTIRVNLVHSQNKPRSVSGGMTETIVRNRARELLSDLENLFLAGRPVALPADHETYTISENETHSTGDVMDTSYGGSDTVSKSKVTSYNSGTPLINLGADPDPSNCITTLSAGVSPGNESITLNDVGCLNGSNGQAAATKIILDPGIGGSEETLDITGFGPGAGDVKTSAVQNSHSSGSAAVSLGNGIGSIW